jgi:hypothetical protein
LKLYAANRKNDLLDDPSDPLISAAQPAFDG